MGSNVTLQIEGVVEAFVTVGALVLLVGRVVPAVAIEHSNVFEALSANLTLVLGRLVTVAVLVGVIVPIATVWRWLKHKFYFSRCKVRF